MDESKEHSGQQETAARPGVVDRRTATREMIDKLLAERQETLVLMCRVGGLEPYTHDKPVMDELREFCQLLVDYMAAGHFGLYQRITEGRERRRGVLEQAQSIYPDIVATTDRAVAFNDKYAEPEPTVIEGDLAGDLSRLGEDIANRIELEDKLIQAMLSPR